MAVETREHDGSSLDRLQDALESYQRSHPKAEIKLYRQNSASIRARIIDPDFANIPFRDRHELVWGYLEPLPDWDQSQVSVLLLLTPDETKKSIANYDFENPRLSSL